MTDINPILNSVYTPAPLNKNNSKNAPNSTKENDTNAQTAQTSSKDSTINADLVTQKTSMISQYFDELQQKQTGSTKLNDPLVDLAKGKTSDTTVTSDQNNSTTTPDATFNTIISDDTVDANGYSQATKKMLSGDNPYDNSPTKAHLQEAQDALFIQWAAKQFGDGKNQAILTSLMKKDLGYDETGNGGKLITVVQKLLEDHGIKKSTEDLQKQFDSFKSNADQVLKYMDKLEHNGSF